MVLVYFHIRDCLTDNGYSKNYRKIWKKRIDGLTFLQFYNIEYKINL